MFLISTIAAKELILSEAEGKSFRILLIKLKYVMIVAIWRLYLVLKA